MKAYETEALRNLVLIGHGGSGKTSLAEAFLFVGQGVSRLGKVDEGTSHFDFDEEEKKRKITIRSSLGFVEWKKRKINFIDTPGYADFVGDVVAAVQVADAAILVVDAQGGVEVGTERAWQFARERGLPSFVAINRTDREHADYDKAVESVREALLPGAVSLTIPIDQGEKFSSVIDVLHMKAFRYAEDGSGNAAEIEIPVSHKDAAALAREKLIERIAETDDSLVEKYLDGGVLTEDEIVRGLRGGVASGSLHPCFALSSSKLVGIDLLLDAISDSGPSPLDHPEVVSREGEKRKAVESEKTAALAFKTLAEAHMGDLTVLRVFSGALESGHDYTNPAKGKGERMGQLYFLKGRDRVDTPRIAAGDIGAAVKLRETKAGDTLCEANGSFALPAIPFPKPVIEFAVTARNQGEEDKIANGLARLQEEDPTFHAGFDGDVRQTIIHGLGELHLDIQARRLKERFGVEVDLTKPRIPYRETIRGRADVQGRYKKQTGGRGQFGDVWLKLEPKERGGGFEFVDEIVGGVVPGKFIPAVEKGVVAAMEEGVLAGCKVVDLRVIIYDGSYHAVDSSENSFKVAGSMAFKKGFLEANPVLLEPIYVVRVTVPDEFMGDVMGDLSSRRGKILGMEAQGPFQIIRAQVPLAELYKYSTHLRSLTQGRGHVEREFSHYEEVPREIAEKVIAETAAAKQEA